jgi:ribonuclease-3
MPPHPDGLESRLGYTFLDRSLLSRALTHRSVVCELDPHRAGPPADNELFEFLGDAVLGFIASDALVRRFPESGEGVLSRLKSYLVSAALLYQVAEDLGIGPHLLLGRGEELSGGRGKRALLANAIEALLAAIYLDGGLEPCREFVERHVLPRLSPAQTAGGGLPLDAKSALQEYAQSHGLPVPRYSTVRESGPDHSKTFTVEVRLGRHYAARAEGPSKKAAGQSAAGEVLGLIREGSPAPH